MSDRWAVVHGDCLDVMHGFRDASVDAVVTDPPYGLAFMGKQWDHGVPGVPFWAEALRVAKPGAHLLAFGGTRTFHRLAVAIEDAGWEIRDCLSWLYGSGFPKSHNLDGAWEGWGTALKPAWEPVIVARKPLVGTVARNVETFGTGALNVDGCRIGTSKSVPWSLRGPHVSGSMAGGTGAQTADMSGMNPNVGRWPANVMLDEDAAAALGEPSRFFYVAKASRSEREAGLREAGLREAGRDPQFASSGRTVVDGEWRETHSEPLPRANTHPTVKPVAVMRWLCRLVTPPSGLVLDPFTGSGTTGVAALREGFRFVGIEREAEYVEIARARIAHAEKDL